MAALGWVFNMKKWVIRFRYISPDDYGTPIIHLPIEETCIEAETAEEAWENMVTDTYAGPRENYKKEEIYERKW